MRFDIDSPYAYAIICTLPQNDHLPYFPCQHPHLHCGSKLVTVLRQMFGDGAVPVGLLVIVRDSRKETDCCVSCYNESCSIGLLWCSTCFLSGHTMVFCARLWAQESVAEQGREGLGGRGSRCPAEMGNGEHTGSEWLLHNSVCLWTKHELHTSFKEVDRFWRSVQKVFDIFLYRVFTENVTMHSETLKKWTKN